MADYVESKLIPDMHAKITMSMEAVRDKIGIGKGFFELFGYDFIVDEEYECWCIEVNTNPCLEFSSPLLEKLIPRMINDALKLTVDQVFPPQKGKSAYDSSKLNCFEVEGCANDENLWL
jgi:tubulin---tyrosine ligase